MDANRALIVQRPEISGLENLERLPVDKIPVVAFLHRTSNVDGQIAAGELGKYLDLAVADWSTNRTDFFMKLALKIGGSDNFFPISVRHHGKLPQWRKDEDYTLNIQDFDSLKEAMTEKKKAPLIAAQRRGFDGKLYKNSGFGAPFLAQYSGEHLVVPVLVDIDYEQVKRGSIDKPLRSAINIATGHRPHSRVVVYEPMELEPIPKEDLDLLIEKRLSGNPVMLQGETKRRVDNTYAMLRSQGDDILMSIARDLPDERLGPWVARIRERYPRPLEHSS
jgi:hypothetical protein